MWSTFFFSRLITFYILWKDFKSHKETHKLFSFLQHFKLTFLFEILVNWVYFIAYTYWEGSFQLELLQL